MAKTLTNKQALVKMINSLDPVQQGLLRERILTMCDFVIENQELVKEGMQNHIVTPEYYIQTMENIKVILEY